MSRPNEEQLTFRSHLSSLLVCASPLRHFEEASRCIVRLLRNHQQVRLYATPFFRSSYSVRSCGLQIFSSPMGCGKGEHEFFRASRGEEGSGFHLLRASPGRAWNQVLSFCMSSAPAVRSHTRQVVTILDGSWRVGAQGCCSKGSFTVFVHSDDSDGSRFTFSIF